MNILITGSSGHLGEALMRTLKEDRAHRVIGADLLPSPYTTHVGSLADRDFVRALCDEGIEAICHTATLHKPHVATHTPHDFLRHNIEATLNLLEEAVAHGVSRFVFTSTTSTFGDALRPPPDSPAAWITEQVVPRPKNIYGVTKTAAEDLCQLFWRDHRLPCVVLRTSRFFPEEDDDAAKRARYDALNAKVNELLYRRVDLEDVVQAHLSALERAPQLGFARYIISAPSPFTPDDLSALRGGAPGVVASKFPSYADIYRNLGWEMFPDIERVYVSEAAQQALGWRPRHTFAHALGCLARGESPFSALSAAVGSKGYHQEVFQGAPYPVRS